VTLPGNWLPCCRLWLGAVDLRGPARNGRHCVVAGLLDLVTQVQAKYSLDKTQRNATSKRSRTVGSSSLIYA
jgi:hypothetical protein